MLSAWPCWQSKHIFISFLLWRHTAHASLRLWLNARSETLMNCLFAARKLTMVTCAGTLKNVMLFKIDYTRTRSWRAESKDTESCKRVWRERFFCFYKLPALIQNRYQSCLRKLRSASYRTMYLLEPLVLTRLKISPNITVSVGAFSHFNLFRNCVRRVLQGWMITDDAMHSNNHDVGSTLTTDLGFPLWNLFRLP